MTEQAEVMNRLAGQVRDALDAADLSAYEDLLDPDVRWGPPDDPAPPCQTRAQVLSWYQRGQDRGTRARVTQTLVSGDKILVGMTVTRIPPGEVPETERWQVLAVRDGRICAITGFDSRGEAAAWAGLAPG
jgi:ketosteroid isomerase-like protein